MERSGKTCPDTAVLILQFSAIFSAGYMRGFIPDWVSARAEANRIRGGLRLVIVGVYA